MRIDFHSTPMLRDGQPAIIAAAWIDAAALADLPAERLARHLALFRKIRFDALLCRGDATAAPPWLDRAKQIAAHAGCTLVLVNAPPLTGTGAGFESAAPEIWPDSLHEIETAGLAIVPIGMLVTAWARRIASGATCWATNLLARPLPEGDPQPAETLVRTLHRLQSFARKQGDLLLRSNPLATGRGWSALATPPRVELTLRQLDAKPVWTVFAINPSPFPAVGPLQVNLGDRAVDLGTVRIKPERFAVFQITADRRPATNRHRPLADLARAKGQSKADATRVNDLLKQGLRVRTLFRGTEV
ncbi:MAG TPA: hypothetical protein VL860_03665 [Planctomycetota bacterium]|nr:hypothetical protein [Planctomycetota bacterium]